MSKFNTDKTSTKVGGMKINLNKSTIICGDNLEWLNWVPDGSIDICYIDPPFFSNRNYEVIWGNGAELRSFGDRFSGGISKYIEWMSERVFLIHRKLKPTGSIFLHCDHHASHRLRSMLDDIFGETNFRNEIIWQRTPFSGSSKSIANKIPCIHDSILYYSKSKAHDEYFRCPEKKYDEKYLKRFKHKDDRGYYRKTLLKTYSQETLVRLKKEGRLIMPSKEGSSYNYKQYLHESNGVVQIGDIWTDINMLNPMAKERLGYPTQKPEALIERILKMASSKHDMVLDCFGGGGTTAKVANDLERKFITGDVSPVACRVIAERIATKCKPTNLEIKNLPTTEEEFRNIEGNEFAKMFCEIVGWKVNEKQSDDGGVDGWDGNGLPVQIKNQKTKTGRPEIQKFLGALMATNYKEGKFVSWEFSTNAIEYISEIKQKHKINIEPIKCSKYLKCFSLLLCNL